MPRHPLHEHFTLLDTLYSVKLRFRDFTSVLESIMQRRSFMNLTAGAAAALTLKSISQAVPQERKTPAPYPDAAMEVLDSRFAKYRVGNAAVERLWTGARWAEGPVWFGDGRYLLFSDIPNNRILRWLEDTGEVSVFRSPSNYANGNYRDRQGRLLTCEHDSRRLTRTEYDGTITVLMDSYQGKKLNAPNDLAVHSDGAIWFSDPGYGILSNYEGHKAAFELPAVVYRLDPKTREATVVATDMDKPNGICFSPDEKKLYIVDTGAVEHPGKPHPIRVYDVEDGARLKNGRLFADLSPGTSDGIRCDTDGNVWSAAGWGPDGFNGVHCFAPDGNLIGKIHLPETCANLCFGGAKHNRLFMAASQSLYSVYTDAQAAQVP
ncbi:MAG TPA: SMP-30/gluconolactonase/LRE family protein [Candidatus Acidoferrum sp.]|nr:SMP-30/gluconolactonase/LRE family protein [Candidatus Acidoferrum sp.]